MDRQLSSDHLLWLERSTAFSQKIVCHSLWLIGRLKGSCVLRVIWRLGESIRRLYGPWRKLYSHIRNVYGPFRCCPLHSDYSIHTVCNIPDVNITVIWKLHFLVQNNECPRKFIPYFHTNLEFTLTLNLTLCYMYIGYVQPHPICTSDAP